MRFLLGFRKKGVRFLRGFRFSWLFWWAVIVLIAPYLLLRRVMIPKPRADQPPRRLLVIQLGGVGDSLMLTPFFRHLRESFPKVKMVLAMAKPAVVDLFRHNPRLKVWPYEGLMLGYQAFREVRGPAQAVRRMLFYFPKPFVRIVLGRFDAAMVCALSTQMENLGGALVYAAGIPRRVGFGENRQGFLDESMVLRHHETHRIDPVFQLWGLWQLSSRGNVDDRYDLSLGSSEVLGIRERICGEGIEAPILAIHPGGAHLAVPRRWPVECFIEVAAWFLKTRGGSVVVTGDADEAELGQRIRNALGGPVWVAAGRLSLRQTAALLAICQVCLTNDTAAMHLAAAVGTPHILAVFGPTDPRLIVPRGLGIHVFQAQLPCIPCAGSVINNHTAPCSQPREGDCLLQVSSNQVVAALQEIAVPGPRRTAT